jgi:hypothetical protein
MVAQQTETGSRNPLRVLKAHWTSIEYPLGTNQPTHLSLWETVEPLWSEEKKRRTKRREQRRERTENENQWIELEQRLLVKSIQTNKFQWNSIEIH